MVAFHSSDVLIAFFILSLFLNETDTLAQLFLAVICDSLSGVAVDAQSTRCLERYHNSRLL